MSLEKIKGNSTSLIHLTVNWVEQDLINLMDAVALKSQLEMNEAHYRYFAEKVVNHPPEIPYPFQH